MTIQWGDTGRAVFGAYKKFNISTKPIETSLSGSPIALGTAEPASPTVSFTLQSSDLPTFNNQPYSTKYCVVLTVAGQNVSGASVTVNYHVLKNGTAVASSGSQASIANNSYFTQNYYGLYMMNVGDIGAVNLWGSASGVNILYYAYTVYPCQLFFEPPNAILKEIAYTIGTPPNATKGVNSTISSTGGWYLPFNDAGTSAFSPPSSTMPAMIFRTSNGTGYPQYGYANTGTNNYTSTTAYPQMANNNMLTSISYRRIL